MIVDLLNWSRANIESSYERVVATVFRPGPQQRGAKHIIEWVLCARRPLKWREVQATFFIDPTCGSADHQGRCVRKSCKSLCGSLVDVQNDSTGVEAESSLHIVHDSARS